MSIPCAGSMAGLGKTVAWRCLHNMNIVRLRYNSSGASMISQTKREQWNNYSEKQREPKRLWAIKAGQNRSKLKIFAPCVNCGTMQVRPTSWRKHVKSGPFCNLGCRNSWNAKINPEKTRAQALRASHANKMQNTKIELLLQAELTKRGIDFKTNWLVGACGLADIFISPNTVIFADGIYWHKYPDGLPKDHRITQRLTELGFVVYRFWEHEIHQNASECIDRALSGGKIDLDL